MATPRENVPVAAPDPAELPPGAVVDNRYRVLRVIGVGGTGIVYEVESVFGGQRLALKTLLDPQHAPRLEQEARALARLKSPHVVKVADFGQCEVGPYMVMTLLVGQNLRDVLESKVKLPLRFVANLALQVCEGLDEAHHAGLIHRDLKPDNLHLADPAGASKSRPPSDQTVATVFDFGVVKMSAELGNNPLTRTGSTVGTPYYMSLEQLRGAGTVDAVSDVYAFCVVLYECLAGQRPFEAGTLGDLIFAICSTTPPHLHSVRPDVPRDVADIVMRGLSREKSERPASMRALATAFSTHADGAFTAWLSESASERAAPAEQPKIGGLSPQPPPAAAAAVTEAVLAPQGVAPQAGSAPPQAKVAPTGLRMPPAAPKSAPSGPPGAALSPRPDPKLGAGPPRPNLPRPPGSRSTARALPNPALLAASALDMPAATAEQISSSPRPTADSAPPASDAQPASGEKAKLAPTPEASAFAKPLSAGRLKKPETPVAASAAQATESPAGSVAEGVATPSAETDSEEITSLPDRETPTEMFVREKHGEGEDDALFNLDSVSGQLPTMDLPTELRVPARRPLRAEDKTALLDIEALKKSPPNPAPTFTRTAPPPAPSGSGHPYPPASQSGVRPMSTSSPNLPSFVDPNSVSGSYSLPGAAFATQALASPGLHNSGLAGGNNGSAFAPSSQGTSPFVKKVDRALVAMGHAGTQLGLKVLLRFRSASQEQQILFVVVGTATFAILAVLLGYLIFL